MLISKINFSSESNLLKKTNCSATKVEPKAAMPSFTPPVNNNVKKWSIGIGSASVLIGFGLLGRKGWLGNGVQKLLGGVTKHAKDAVEAAESKLPEVIHEIPKPPKVNVDVDFEKINAGLNRLIPSIDMPSKIEVPNIKYLAEEFKNINPSGFKDNYSKTFLPNGNTREIFLTVDGKRVASVIDKTPQGQVALEAKFLNEEFLELKNGNEAYSFRGADLCRYAVDKDGKIYTYNSKGSLLNMSESNSEGKVKRIINFQYDTDEVSNIIYINPEKNEIIKQDIFANGKVIQEVFYTNRGSEVILK